MTDRHETVELSRKTIRLEADMSYEIMLAYERDDCTDDLPQAVADELRIGLPHTTNWPCFGVLALDFIRTLEWRVPSLPDDPMVMCQRFRDAVPTVRGFAIYETDAPAGSLPLFAWQAHNWVEAWKPPVF
jgi:hypothetical protein